MKRPHQPQSATSLPRAPRDDASARSRRYLIMMAIRMVCFLLMVLITPYGWQTWLFGIAAILLPYIAVVNANNSEDLGSSAQNPERALPSAATAPKPAPADSTVIRIEENKSPGRSEPGGDG
ncbi:DUF3099 domain-containing protein [Microbacterium sp. R86528]|uniref:DUF3099 domain-containing protein n=1 Tax=Microbacterium sp. R86528 TaxID=3093864 RepID=UPI0037C729A5